MLVRPRNVQLLPSHDAALLLHRENVTPRQAYVEILGTIRGDGNDESCADVLTWLRAASTCRGVRFRWPWHPSFSKCFHLCTCLRRCTIMCAPRWRPTSQQPRGAALQVSTLALCRSEE